MGLVARTGRRSWKVRLLHLGILLILSAGALSMSLPFILMLSGSTRTGVDRTSLALLPPFLQSQEALYQKYVEALYNESPSQLRAAWGGDWVDFSGISLLSDPNEPAVQAWEQLCREHGEVEQLLVGFASTPVSRGRPLAQRDFADWLREKISPDMAVVNQALETDFPDWNAFRVIPLDGRSRLGVAEERPFRQAWQTFSTESLQPWMQTHSNIQGYFRERIQKAMGGDEALSRTVPTEAGARERWELFVREALHPAFIRMNPEAAPAWRSYMERRFAGELSLFEERSGLSVQSWAELPFPESRKDAGALAPEWDAWLQGWSDSTDGQRYEIAIEALSIQSLDLIWREEQGGAAPLRDAVQLQFLRYENEIRSAFLWQNVNTVVEILLLHGRGLRNTVIYCTASVILALLVNPMAAYGLSRYRPKHAYLLLLYLLLTMAFPPMVTQIPVFLMLRDFGMLNTFWALLLPGMAHGYSIFLLKGFFDSLPQELYESASLDGAGELRMFKDITLALSKPILAVIALGAFVNAYTAFMFALLICQDERMWTIMVWLYQLQQEYGPGVMNAAFVLAAIPTLFVFLIAQRQIIRGIVVPTEK